MRQSEDPGAVLDSRARHLFRVLVESYIREGRPVGSRRLARTAGLDLSPATVRNVMADLEELGFVRSPHTSAGRVPTARGYRLFVDTLLRVRPLRDQEVERLQRSLDPDLDTHGLLSSASALLSGVTELAGLVTVPRRERAVLRHIELLNLSHRRVLAILVTNGREVQNRILYLDRDYQPHELQEVANYLNERFAGQDLSAARDLLDRELQAVKQDLNRLVLNAAELGHKAFSQAGADDDDLVTAGETNLMGYDELSSVEKLRQLFEAFNEKEGMLHLLDRCISAEGVQIFIGQESGYEVLEECSMVTTPYSVAGEVVGVLGVVGPTRMAYDRVIPIVDVTAKILGAALNWRDTPPRSR